MAGQLPCYDAWAAAGRGVASLLLVLVLSSATGAAAQDPAGFDDLAARAAAARDAQDVPRAIDLYTQAEKLKPDWAEGWFYLGMLRYGGNQYPEAIEAFNHLLQLAPSAVPAMVLRGLCEFETGAYDDSLKDLETAVVRGAANDPRNEQIIRYHLAQLLARAGRFEDALAQYKFFAGHKIDNEDVLVGLGAAGLRVAALSKDLPAQNRDLYAGAGRAGMALLADDSEEAEARFRELFARYPKAPNLHFFYGFLLFPHEPDLAIDQFRSEVGVAPGNDAAQAMLAFSLMVAGRFAEAVPVAEMAVAAAPDLEMAQLALGRSLAETGDVKRGTELLNQVLKGDPDNLEAHQGLAAIYSRMGRREDAYRERMVCLGLSK